MKRLMSLLLITAWAAAGCDTLPRLWEQPKPAPSQASKPVPAKPALTADQISDNNAQAAAEALNDEIKRDCPQETLTPRVK
jgi:hypothetical protein